MLDEILVDFKDFSKEVIKGKTYLERKKIFWQCYAVNPTMQEVNNMPLDEMIKYVKETDEFYEQDKKYIDACLALIKEME